MINIRELESEIQAENDTLRATMNRHLPRPEVSMGDAILAEGLLAIYERLGDMMRLGVRT